MIYQRCRSSGGLTISEAGQVYLLIQQLHIRPELRCDLYTLLANFSPGRAGLPNTFVFITTLPSLLCLW